MRDPIAQALIASGAHILGQSAAAASHTGDTAETTLATITVPAGTMGANGRIEVKARFSFSGTAGGKTPRIKFGGTSIFAVAQGSTITFVQINAEVANRNAANSQYGTYQHWTSGAAGVPATTTAAVDATADVTLLITGQLNSAADTITLESYQVILFPKG